MFQNLKLNYSDFEALLQIKSGRITFNLCPEGGIKAIIYFSDVMRILWQNVNMLII